MIAAIDVGGTKIAGALIPESALRPPVGVPMLAAEVQIGEPVVSSAANLHDLVERLAGSGPVTAVGVGFCEYVDGNRLTSREVVDWDRQPADWLPEVFGDVPVVVDSDVRCGLRAELRAGAALNTSSTVFVSWGTGLSCALAVEGRIWSGHRGRAIALGEWLTPGGRLEDYVSGAGMAARAGDGRTARQLMVSADPDDRDTVESAGRVLADALAALVAVLDPECIVLGGGLGGADHPARRALFDRWSALGATPRLLPAAFGPHGPLIGAAWAAVDELDQLTGRNRSAVNR